MKNGMLIAVMGLMSLVGIANSQSTIANSGSGNVIITNSGSGNATIVNGLTLAPLNAADLALANPAIAQAAGQQVLDAVPGFSALTNLPTTTFNLAKVEIFLGLENTGATMQNLIAAHYDFASNFFAGGQITLGAGSQVINSAGINAGLRHAWLNSEIYGGLAGVRNWQTGLDTFEGEAFAGYAYKPSSGFAVFAQLETFVAKSTAAPALGYVCGVLFPF